MNIYLLGCAFIYGQKIGMSYSASGIEFEAENGFEVLLTADKCGELADGEIHYPRYALFCDGEMVRDSRIVKNRERVICIVEKQETAAETTDRQEHEGYRTDNPETAAETTDMQECEGCRTDALETAAETTENQVTVIRTAAGVHSYKLIKLSESADSTMFVEFISAGGRMVHTENGIDTGRGTACPEQENGAGLNDTDCKKYKQVSANCREYDQKLDTTISFVEYRKTPGRLLIEYIGDSITCGYGVEGKLSPEDHYTTATENCTKAYAYLSAGLLDADCRLVSKSGSGIISGYTGDGIRNTMNLLAPVYDRVGCSWAPFEDGVFPADVARNGDVEPDITVINLGTNDVSYCYPAMGFNVENISEEEKNSIINEFVKNEAENAVQTATDDDRKASESLKKLLEEPKAQDFIRKLRCDLFYREYRKFLLRIRKKYPATTIISTKGIMNTELNDVVERALNDSKKEDIGENAFFYAFKLYDTENDGIGTDYHPSEISQRKAAAELVDFIQSVR